MFGWGRAVSPARMLISQCIRVYFPDLAVSSIVGCGGGTRVPDIAAAARNSQHRSRGCAGGWFAATWHRPGLESQLSKPAAARGD
eukprot:8787861-Alexandrium_andersonii.AAC.1